MTIKTRLLAAGSALLLSAGAAAAVPAVSETDLNLRSGPGTGYSVVATIPDGATVDVESCTGSWCLVNFGGTTGYASRSYLSMAGAPSSGVVVQAPSYVVPDDDYYGYGYTYGPSFGFYTSPVLGYHGRRDGWHGRPGWRGDSAGKWRDRGNWQNRPGRIGGIGGGQSRGGMNVPSGMNRHSAGAPPVSAPVGMRGGQVSAPAGMRGGMGAGAMRGGGAAVPAAPTGGAGAQGSARAP